MANSEIKFDSKVAEEFFKSIGRNVEGIQKKERAFWSGLQSLAYAQTIRNFEQERGPKGSWDSWSDIYQKRMAKIGKGANKKLQDSGRMRQTVLFAFNRQDVQDGVLLVNPAKTKDGFPYAAHHDEGRSSFKGNAREFFWLSSDTLDKFAKLTLAFAVRS